MIFRALARIAPSMSLRTRILLGVTSIVMLVVVAQTIVSLSVELTYVDQQVHTEGTIIAQGLANACAYSIEGDDPGRFEHLIERTASAIDLVELVIVDTGGQVVGSSNPELVGETLEGGPRSVFEEPRPNLGLGGVLRGTIEYSASAPIVRSTVVVGFVRVRFLSDEVSKRGGKMVASAAALGLFWLVFGAIAAVLSVRQITKPLAELTKASTDVIEGRLREVALDSSTARDEVGLLRSTFAHLVESLQREEEENQRLLRQLTETNERLRRQVDVVNADLRGATAYLMCVVQSMDQGVITCDIDGEIVQVNQAAARQLCGFVEPKPGLSIEEIIPDGGALRETVLRAIRENRIVPRFELERTRPLPIDASSTHEGIDAGLERLLLFRVSPMLDDDGVPFGAVVTCRDQTEERRVQTRLQRHERLVAMGTMAAGLAHELGNYMSSVKGFSSLLLRSTPESDPRRADMQTIDDECGRAVSLLRRFLLFARPRMATYTPEPIDVLVRESMSMAGYQASEAEVEIIDQLGVGDLMVMCDSHQLEQVFVNIVLNAIDALSTCRKRELVVSSSLVGDDRVEVRFRDTGVGVDPEHAEHIFDLFFTTKPDGGTGLGLCIAHRIVEQHGGCITVESAPGGGAIFVVELPIDGPEGVAP